MTEPSDAHPTDDEVASAALDGETTPEERARVEAEPELADRVATFGRVRDHLAVGDPPAGVLDGAVDAALGAFDARHGRAEAAAGTGGVRHLDQGRARRFQQVGLGAAAAAIVVLALVGLTQLDTGGDDDTTTAVAADEEAGDDADDASAGASAEDAPEGDTFGSGETGDGADALPASPAGGVQSYADVDTLVAELARGYGADVHPTRSDTDDGGGREPPALEPTSRCDAPSAADVDPVDVVALVPAVVDDREVLAVVYDSEGARRVAIVDVASCGLDDDRAL